MSARTLLMAAGGYRQGPPGASLDLSFMTPGTLDPRITFTRASTGTYFDATGTMQTAAPIRRAWTTILVTHLRRGMLIEETAKHPDIQQRRLHRWRLGTGSRHGDARAAGCPGRNRCTNAAGRDDGKLGALRGTECRHYLCRNIICVVSVCQGR